MLKESQLIPYHTIETLPGSNWLVFAPHADDETFGMGGTLLLAKQQAINTSLVIMTNGVLGITEQEKSLAADTRQKEARQAAQLLGINTISFLDEEDRGLSIKPHTIKKITTLIEQYKPDCIFVPAPLELHPDHRMTTALVYHALLNMSLKTTLYGYEISVQGFINTLVDISSVAPQKDEVIQCYQSQIQQNNYNEVVQALNIARTYTLPDKTTRAEGFLKLEIDKKQSPERQLQGLLNNYFIGVMPPQPSSHELQQQITQLKYDQQQLLQSSSWQITRPLRWLKQFLSRILP